jgi:hypothetical protein
VAESTRLEIEQARKGLGGSNPPRTACLVCPYRPWATSAQTTGNAMPFPWRALHVSEASNKTCDRPARHKGTLSRTINPVLEKSVAVQRR